MVYVTVGAEGCFWLENEHLMRQEGGIVNFIDTTGAGDVFHGAFAFAVDENMDTRAAVVFSNTVAAIKCTKLGGWEGIPDRNTVDTEIAE